jgi:dipeptidyl-peptidase-4
MQLTFPRQQARTRRFALGAPRTVTVSPDGTRVVFVRSQAGDDPNTALWLYDVDRGTERLIADPATLLGSSEQAEVPAAERARRERARETAGGIVAYATDSAVMLATLTLGGRLWCVDLLTAESWELPAAGPVIDPRLDPSGRLVAYCSDNSLHVVSSERHGTGKSRVLVSPDAPEVIWGQAEFVAAEEMDRRRGYWWAPDGNALLVARVDNSPVGLWWISDPAHPDRPPVAHRYPAAGTADAEVTLFLMDLDGSRTAVDWDRRSFPYLFSVAWQPEGPALLTVISRDHRRCQVLALGTTGAPTTGAPSTSLVAETTDDCWVEPLAGTPAWLPGGRLLWAADLDDTHRLTVDGGAVTPVGLQVRQVLHASGTVVFTASSEPTEVELWTWSEAGGARALEQPPTASTTPSGRSSAAADGEGRVESAALGGETVVVASRSMHHHGTHFDVVVKGRAVHRLANLAQAPLVDPRVRFLRVGPRELRVGVVLPTGHQPGTSLPVVMSPYGGPGAQMVLSARSAWLEDQWLADQGFAVVVADGRGTPGRGPSWDRTVFGDLASGVLEDQVEALQGAAAQISELDLSRVGIRGWSFGGYLSALAVLRRPDIFHAAVAGAPVTDWRLYDTFYTERLLGHPGVDPGPYLRSGLLEDAHLLSRPLMLIHGLADDNVTVAHTLQLSDRLTRAGRAHTVLPLPGVTHMPIQEEAAENLLILQVDFLRRALSA